MMDGLFTKVKNQVAKYFLPVTESVRQGRVELLRTGVRQGCQIGHKRIEPVRATLGPDEVEDFHRCQHGRGKAAVAGGFPAVQEQIVA
jgi:hypothetical protein